MTWLYGPLQGYSGRSSASSTALSGTGRFDLDLVLNTKPILKKRSALEIMLQLSLYRSSSLKPSLLRQGYSDEFLPVTLALNKKRRIHFQDNVEQLAVTDIGDHDDKDIEHLPTVEDLVRRNVPTRNSFTATSKAATILPSTMLRYQQDVLGVVEDKVQEGNGWLYLANSPDILPSLETATDIVPSCVEEGRDKGDAVVVPGLFSRVADALKTAKDIAFFLWNTG